MMERGGTETGGEERGETRLLVREDEGVVGAVDWGEGMAMGALATGFRS